MKTYSHLLRISSFLDRFEYLRLFSTVGIQTFGYNRYINQKFYNSREWKNIRTNIISRDNGCDLGIPDRPIYDAIRVHHMNPITIEDFSKDFDKIVNPEFLICTSESTHNAIHYGSEINLKIPIVERRRGDTTPWIVY